MRKILLLLVLNIFINLYANSIPNHSYYTARREPNERGLTAYKNMMAKLKNYKLSIASDTPMDVAKPLNQISYKNVAQLANYDEVIKEFNNIRDTRFINYESSGRLSQRRIPWEYPEDFCYARAGAANIYLRSNSHIRPSLIFVFGDLSAKSVNAMNDNERVNWNYHVAPIVQEHDNIYVLDPAINPNKPLLVHEWYDLMHDQNLKAAICDTYTYYPNDSCLHPKHDAAKDNDLMQDVKFAIFLEQQNFDVIFFGDTPPWKWKNPKTFGNK